MDKPKTLMFGFVTVKINPIGGRCIHDCKYGYCTEYAEMYNMRKYAVGSQPTLYPSELKKFDNLTADDTVFLDDMNDLFAKNVPSDIILTCLQAAGTSKARVLLLSKNPARMVEFIDDIPKNCIVGMTAETNRGTTAKWSKAPLPFDRFASFMEFVNEPFERMICVEPIADFDLPIFSQLIIKAKPKLVAIGYNNYPHRYQLPEPYLSKTTELIELLKMRGIDIHTKTLREKLS